MKNVVLILLVTIPLSLFAQRHHEIGLVGGVSGYRGDLSPGWIPHEKSIMPTAGIMYKYFMNPKWGIRGGVNFIQITAADSLSSIEADRLRNLSFTNRLIEFNAGIEYNLLPIDVYKFKVTPYLHAGIAGFYSNPWADDRNGDKVFLRDFSTEGQGLSNYPERKPYSTINASFPIGMGIKAFVGKTLMVTAEVNLRYAATDYLDDVSRTYVNMDTLEFYKGIKSVEMSYRGNELGEWDGNYPNYKFRRGDYKNTDWYWTATLGITIYFHAFGNPAKWSGADCPSIFGRKDN